MGRRKKLRTVTLHSHEDSDTQGASGNIVDTPRNMTPVSASLEELEDQMIDENLENEDVEGKFCFIIFVNVCK